MRAQKPKLLHFCITTTTITLFFMLATWPSWQTIWTIWMEDGSGYSHGPLIILVALWLIYECWQQLQKSMIMPRWQSYAAICMGIMASAAWAIGHISGVSLLYWVSLPIMALALIISYSRQAIRPATFAPALALFFAVPVWELIVPILQKMAVQVVGQLLRMANLPAYIQGIDVHIPGGTFVIEGGCSGIRFLLVSLAITSLWSFLQLHRHRDRILLIGFSLIISIASNWLRIFMLVIIGYNSKMQSEIVYDHEYFGWIIFAISLVPIYGVAFWLERRTPMPNPISECQPQWHMSKLMIGFVLMSLLPLLAQHHIHGISTAPAPQFITTLNGGFFQEEQYRVKSNFELNSGRQNVIFGGWKPQFNGVDQWQTYKYKPSNLQILVGHISRQNQSQELLSSGNNFRPLNPSIQWFQSIDNNTIYLRNIYGQRWVGKLVYIIGGKLTKPGMAGKLTQLQQTIQGRLDGQLLVIGLPCQSKCQAESKQLSTLQESTIMSWIKQQ